jgi:O-antigen ligase
MILLSGALVALNSLAAMGLAIAGVLGGFLLSHPVFKGWHERFGGEPRIGFTLVVAAVLLLGALMWFTSEPGAGGKGALLLHGGHFRQIIHSIARQMAMAAPITGNGANSLVYLLPEYHPLVPEFRAHLYETQPDLNRILLMHVDGDWMEFLVEHGFVGTSIALASMLAAFAAALQGGRAGLCIAMGVAAVLFHGAVDSVLREPVILAHIGVLCGLAPLLAPAKDGCKTR